MKFQTLNDCSLVKEHSFYKVRSSGSALNSIGITKYTSEYVKIEDISEGNSNSKVEQKQQYYSTRMRDVN